MEADICGKCGGVLTANERRTKFKCPYCGMKYNLPGAPILARSLRDNNVKEAILLTSADEVRPQKRKTPPRVPPRRRPPPQQPPPLSHSVSSFFRLINLAISWVIFGTIWLMIAGIGVGGILRFFLFRKAHPGQYWESEWVTYGIGAGWMVMILSLLLFVSLFKPSR